MENKEERKGKEGKIGSNDKKKKKNREKVAKEKKIKQEVKIPPPEFMGIEEELEDSSDTDNTSRNPTSSLSNSESPYQEVLNYQ